MQQIKSDRVQSHDGTKISYQVFGRGKETMILVPGLAVPNLAYQPLMQALGKYRFITWHSRGTYQSERPSKKNFSVEDHVADLEAIIKREKVTKFGLAGWSLAVQTILCFAHRHPEKVKSLILISGTYKGVINSRMRAIESPIKKGLKLARPFGRLVDPGAKWLARQDLDCLKPFFKYSRLSANPDDFFINVLKEFAIQPMDVMIDTIRASEDFNGENLLPHIHTPTFISSGTRDPFVPTYLGRTLANGLANAQLSEIKGGTHYTLFEKPDLIMEPLKKFLETSVP